MQLAVTEPVSPRDRRATTKAMPSVATATSTALPLYLHLLGLLVAAGATRTPLPANVPLVMVGLANGGNPGESPPATSFDDPAKLERWGFDAVTILNHELCANFSSVSPEVFPAGSPSAAWLATVREGKQRELAAYAARGLKVISKLDMVVLPQTLLKLYKTEVTDPKTGKLSFARNKTRELLSVMFDEVVALFPQIDGFQVRVGEVYLQDAPYHAGAGAVDYRQPFAVQQAEYVALLRFLRQELCVKHGKRVIFRTWDTQFAPPYRFHGSPQYYLNVTGQITPHPMLYFSIKHTQLDFWRWSAFNPCLGIGDHAQIVEVECQREYEGKGAHPNYIAQGVIEGFAEVTPLHGLQQALASSPLVRGVWTWARGGGWQGPYITGGGNAVGAGGQGGGATGEFWEDLNVYVVSKWVAARLHPSASSSNSGAELPTEAQVFARFCAEELGLNQSTAEAQGGAATAARGASVCAALRRLALASSSAVLHMHYCAAYDSTLQPPGKGGIPTNNWMRDDCLGGDAQLKPVFSSLHHTNGFAPALAEKAQAVTMWEGMLSEAIALQDAIPDSDNNTGLVRWRRQLETGVRYGLTLSRIIFAGWRVLSLGYQRQAGGGSINRTALAQGLADYDNGWASFNAFRISNPYGATLYRDTYSHGSPGLGNSVKLLRSNLTMH